MSPMTSPGRRKDGQSMVEFALTITVFLLLLLGSLDFGRAIYARTVLSSAAREGARFGIVDPTNSSGIAAAARGAVPGVEATITSRCSPNCQPNSSLTVTATTTFRPISMFFPTIALNGVSIKTIE